MTFLIQLHSSSCYYKICDLLKVHFVSGTFQLKKMKFFARHFLWAHTKWQICAKKKKSERLVYSKIIKESKKVRLALTLPSHWWGWVRILRNIMEFCCTFAFMVFQNGSIKWKITRVVGIKGETIAFSGKYFKKIMAVMKLDISRTK